MRKTISILLVLALAAFAVFAAGSKEAQAPATTSRAPVALSLAMNSTWGNLCPLSGTSSYDQYIYDALYEKLVFITGEYKLEPRAADSWDVSADNTVYTFHLNKNVKWSDGQPVTAKDWVFAAQLATNPAFNTARKSFYANYVGTDASGNQLSDKSVAWKAVDDYTLQITLKNPQDITAFMISNNNSIFPFPVHKLGSIAPAEILENAYWQNPLCCGPMVFESQVVGSELHATVNKDYYRGAIQFDSVVYHVIPQKQLATAFLAGELDFSFNSMATLDDVLSTIESGKVVANYTKTPISTGVLDFNSNTLSDARIRQAIRYCVDLESIGQVLYSGEVVISAMPTVPSGAYYDPKYESYTEYNLDKAKALFDEAGWDYNRVINFGTPTGPRADAAAIIQQSLLSIGVKSEITTGDASTILANERNGVYDMGIVSFTNFTNDPSTMLSNLYLYCYGLDDTMKNLLANVSSKLTEAERAEEAMKFFDYYFEYCPMTNIYKTPMYYVNSTRVSGWDSTASVANYNVNYIDFIVK